MKRVALLCVVACFPMLALAADNPKDVIEAQQYGEDACVQRATDDCVNTICLNSSDRGCPDNCQHSAQAKCEVATHE